MDDFERLINAYRVRESSSVSSKLSVLRDVELIRDDRVVPFLLTVLADTREAEEVRIHVLKQLRNGDGRVAPADRPRVANAISAVLAARSTTELRLQAALAPGEFIRIDGVLSVLGPVAFAQDESIDLRYAAFTSLERAGPTPESISYLQRLSTDATLGGSARSVLSAWHVAVTGTDKRQEG
jgi:hypothetical protein